MTSRQVQLHVTGVDLVTQDTLLSDGHACTEALVLKTSVFGRIKTRFQKPATLLLTPCLKILSRFHRLIATLHNEI